MKEHVIMSFGSRLTRILEDPATVELAKRYYADDDGRPAYSGSWFEALGGRGDRGEQAYVVTSADLTAITTLSVRLDGHEAIQVLEANGQQLAGWLSEISPTATILSEEGQRLLLEKESPLRLMWQSLREVKGPVTAGKICARKRPALVPIWDSVVRAQLKPKSGKWWSSMVEAMSDDFIAERAFALHAALAPLAHTARGVELSPLRAVDIAVWMTGKADRSPGA